MRPVSFRRARRPRSNCTRDDAHEPIVGVQVINPLERRERLIAEGRGILGQAAMQKYGINVYMPLTGR